MSKRFRHPCYPTQRKPPSTGMHAPFTIPLLPAQTRNVHYAHQWVLQAENRLFPGNRTTLARAPSHSSDRPAGRLPHWRCRPAPQNGPGESLTAWPAHAQARLRHEGSCCARREPFPNSVVFTQLDFTGTARNGIGYSRFCCTFECCSKFIVVGRGGCVLSTCPLSFMHYRQMIGVGVPSGYAISSPNLAALFKNKVASIQRAVSCSLKSMQKKIVPRASKLRSFGASPCLSFWRPLGPCSAPQLGTHHRGLHGIAPQLVGPQLHRQVTSHLIDGGLTSAMAFTRLQIINSSLEGMGVQPETTKQTARQRPPNAHPRG